MQSDYQTGYDTDISGRRMNVFCTTDNKPDSLARRVDEVIIRLIGMFQLYEVANCKCLRWLDKKEDKTSSGIQ